MHECYSITLLKSVSDTVVLAVVSTLVEVSVVIGFVEVIVVLGFVEEVSFAVATVVVEASTSLHTLPSQRHLLFFVVAVVLVVVLVTVVVEVDLVVVLFELEGDLADVVRVLCCGVGLDFGRVEVNPTTEIRNCS